MTTAIVIDDSAVARRSIRPLLEAAGCRVVAEGASGDDVMHLYETHKPTLVTMDIVMPGKDGVTAATELLLRYPEATVIMCTSLTSRDKILACQKAGVAHYLLKPFQPEKTVQVIRYVLGRMAERQAAGGAPPAAPRTEGGA
jgi:two-component system chemotaxis response regulator CheY